MAWPGGALTPAIRRGGAFAVMPLAQGDKCWGFGGSAPKIRLRGMRRRSCESPAEKQDAKLPESATVWRLHPLDPRCEQNVAIGG